MKKLTRSKVLVTGAGGFIGSHVCELCLAEGAEVRAFVHYNSRSDWGMLNDLDKKSLHDIEVVTGDLRDPDAFARAVQRMPPSLPSRRADWDPILLPESR